MEFLSVKDIERLRSKRRIDDGNDCPAVLLYEWELNELCNIALEFIRNNKDNNNETAGSAD